MYNPGYFKISKEKVKQIINILMLDKDDIKSIKKNLKNTKNTLKEGDTQPSKVISLDPLLIACYSDEFNNVLIYEYPKELVEMYSLKTGKYLISSNSYWYKECFDIEDDIIPGKNCSKDWRDVITFIPLFLCNENQEGRCYCFNVEKDLLNHIDELIKEYQEKKPGQYRKGFKTLIKY